MRAGDIHAVAELLTGEALRWTSVKAALAGAASRTRRFQRISHGVYERAGCKGIGLQRTSLHPASIRPPPLRLCRSLRGWRRRADGTLRMK